MATSSPPVGTRLSAEVKSAGGTLMAEPSKLSVTGAATAGDAKLSSASWTSLASMSGTTSAISSATGAGVSSRKAARRDSRVSAGSRALPVRALVVTTRLPSKVTAPSRAGAPYCSSRPVT